jgi:hypothetical protein
VGSYPRAVQFLTNIGHFEEEVDGERGSTTSILVVFDIEFVAQEVVGEGSQASDNVGVLSDAVCVLLECDVAHVMTGVLDAPYKIPLII